MKEPHAFGEVNPWFATVESGAEVCAAAMRTPPHNLILSFFGGDPERILSALIPAVTEAFGSIPGVIGHHLRNAAGVMPRHAWRRSAGNLLEAGIHFCVLYADSANRTSNDLYRRIGFTEAGDSVRLRFDR
ncbi:MAG: hypothetical protein ABIJ00_13235 [Candidatus Eisenbacteria bacterium]